ncbi:CTLH/CRA C-terminal to lish motif domain-containing protein [Phycomyces blakesleeanus]|uniref:CTLH/CRA C-terminal to lish motif domain-containing protein n=1 Tax=Phycomyces blakesleeanus TaxID=4837 RepID=A0ABR3AUW8_PHYBL
MSDITDSACITIVTEYLLNNCYKNTAKALQFETNKLAARSEDLSGQAPTKSTLRREMKNIYDSILAGNIDRAIQDIRFNFPIMAQVNPTAEEPSYYEILMYKLACQEFVEIVRSGEELEAIKFAHTHLGTRHQTLQEIITRVSPLIAYHDPTNCSSSYLFDHEQRQALADEVNMAVLTLSGLPTETALEKLSKQHNVVKDTLNQMKFEDPAKDPNSDRKMSM